ncbi:MAG: AsmA family protein [Deltaproteobacteria bacterium]|nr:AsmA family protein [Deltaproteobacteria bacterium]
MRWKKILVIFGVIILGLTAASLIILFSYDYNKFKPYIAQAARDATGRELKLTGDLKLHLGFTPALAIENISFQNASWGSRPEMAHIKRFELEVALLPLISRNIQINRFRLIEPDILLEINKDGVSNLAFEKKKEARPPEPKEKKKDERIDLPGFLIREMLIEKGRLTYRDARSGKTYALALDQFSISMAADKPIEIKGKGAYNKAPIDLTARFGSLEALTDPAKEWPLKMKVEVAETIISLDGTVRDLLGARGFQLNMEVRSKDLTKLSPLVGSLIPVKGPLEISGKVTDPGPQVYRIADLKMILDKSDVRGGAEIDLKGPRPYVSGNFSSRLLDLKSLIPQKPEAAVKASKDDKLSKKADKVFPNDPLPIDFLKSLDAELEVAAEKILVPHLILEKVQVEARLKDGTLVLKPLQAVIGGGSLDAFVNLRSEGNEAALISVIKIDRFDVGLLLKDFGVTDLFEGKVDMILDLQGRGNSVASIMAGLSGKTQAIMSKGRVDRRYIDLLGAGVSENLLRLLNPLKQQAKEVQLNCFVNFFDIKNGLAKSTALALDTSYITVVGEGTVNLKTEELNFSFNPLTKDTLGTKGAGDLGLGDLTKPLKLTGTLAKPALDVSAGQASLAVGKILGGELAGLAGSIAGGRSKTEQDFCLAAIETAKRGGKETPQRKEKGAIERTTEGVKGATDQARDAFKKIFRK